MHALRTSPILARLVLAWFVLTLGVAAASPIMAPTSVQQVCSEAGVVTLVLVDHEGRALEADQHALDCPLCLPAFMPTAFTAGQVSEPRPLAQVRVSRQQARVAAPAGAALPARGPPSPR